MTPGQIVLVILAWLIASAIVATRVGTVIAYVRFGPPVTIGVDWPWWKAFRYSVVVFAALQVAAVALVVWA